MRVPRILTSSKYHAALVVTGLAVIRVLFIITDSGISRADKQDKIETTFKWVAGAWMTSTAAIGAEDALTNLGKGATEAAPPTAPAQAPEAKSDVTVNVAAPPVSSAVVAKATPARTVVLK